MNELDEQRRAAEALATVREHQERTRRAARLPWWLYPVMFVVSAGCTALNDFVGLGGAKLIAVLVLATLVAVLVAGFASGTPLMGRVRGVQPRQSFSPRVFGGVVLVGSLAVWLIFRYGNGFTVGVANAVGLRDYPATVAGVLFGAVFTLLFALSQALLTASRRRTNG